ncbi:MAG TPA: hypothetical protein DDZ66_05205 [Firmicutes bacterium]|nr:hypothetical protein [Bacillota bacterium]
MIFIRSDISTKEAAIEFLGKKLIDNGFSNEGFIESVIKREQLSSTCFFDAFAVPHALEMNSNQTAFAVLINDKGGILWDKHRIKLCILMAVCESERRAFSQTYNNIVRVLSDMNRLRSLTRCTNLPEFLSELKSIR